jgi:glycosyltransferase involved in cell wall biosynthesis
MEFRAHARPLADAPPPETGGPARRVAMVLPAKEQFATAGAGAVALVVRDVAAAVGIGWRATILGAPVLGAPFPGVAFVPLHRHPLEALFTGRSGAHARAAARALRADPHAIIEVHNRPALALHLARALRPTPVILVVHNEARTMGGLRTPAERAALLRDVRAVVCVSEFVRDGFLAGLPPTAAARVRAIPNGLNLDAWPPGPATPREPLILFVGRLNADKGADNFVRAAARALPQLPGWRAAMVGDSWFGGRKDTPFVTALRAEARAAGVDMLGYLDNAATLATMGRAAMVVMPNRWAEPMGRVAQEALASGTPLIASARGGLPEAAGDAALHVDPESVEAIATAMLALARDPARCEAMATAGRAHVGNFAMPKVAARWAALRAEVIAGGE